ncbi:hypothetical protein R6Q57_021084 [Mikania cordata]
MANQRYQIASPPMMALSPKLLLSNTQEIIGLPSSIDIDYTLSESLSSLNLSPNNHSIPMMFLHQTDGDQHVYSGVGRATMPLAIDPPHDHDHDHDQGPYSPGFDPELHLDYESYLFVKELVSSPVQQQQPCNGSHSSETLSSIPQESVHYNNSYTMPSDCNLNEPFLSRLTLKELRRLICVLAIDERGCEVLKSKIVTATEEEIGIVLYELMGSVAYLMKHKFGNSLIQKLICVCNDDQRAFIVREMTYIYLEIIDVCMDPYGTRAILKLLENLKSPNLVMRVIWALRHGVVLLANDPNGHRVLQFCLTHFDSDFNQLILDQIADNCVKVATDRSGCCVMQACVERSHGVVRNRLVANIIANAVQLAEDPFGNYVLQHMVELKSPGVTELLVRQFQGCFESLSKNKYASNVVEKCLMESQPYISTMIVLELVGSSNPSSLLVDPYGNFVIQSALKVSKGFAYKCLLKLVSSNVTSMQSNLYGKKILDRIEKRRPFTFGV